MAVVAASRAVVHEHRATDGSRGDPPKYPPLEFQQPALLYSQNHRPLDFFGGQAWCLVF